LGVGIFFLALGAILAFAVNWTVAGLDLHVVGWVLMAAGAVGLIIYFYLRNVRSRNRRRVPLAPAQQLPPREAFTRLPLAREPSVPDGRVYDARQYDARHYDDPSLPPPP
jgi:hypothetical protein